MRITHRIGLVGGLPLFILAVIAWQVMSPKLVLRSGSQKWKDSTTVMIACSSLARDLQVERGATAVHLKGGPRAPVEAARKDTDAAAAEFRTTLDGLGLGQDSRAALDAVADAVAGMRRQADGGSPVGDVVKAYTSNIQVLVDRVQDEAQQKTDKGVGKRFLALASLEQTKEYAGRFRANLAGAAAADKALTSIQVVALAALHERAAGGLASPILVLDGNNREKLGAVLASSQWKHTEDYYETVMARSQAGGYGLDAQQVFGDVTGVIDQVDAVLQDQYSRVADLTDKIYHDANVSLVGWSLALLVAFVGSALITLRVSTRLTAAMAEALDLADAIAQGDTSRRIHVSGRDELSRLGTALNRMADSLAEQAAVAEHIAGGDLTVSVQVASDRDRFGLALRNMVERLRDLIGQVRVNSDRVATGAREISDTGQSLSQGTTEQAASLQQISASVTEISDRTRENADGARSASEATRTVQEAADAGSARMQALRGAMEEISASSARIAVIIKTVDDIAFQTNLLALNAAVEAARAGSHGRGFAVVAEEVRQLAGRSAKAARETSELIADTTGKVRQGTELSADAAESFEAIAADVNRAATMVDEIARTAVDQATSIAEISDGLRQVDTVVQQSSANAEELASASQMLVDESRNLQNQIGAFRTGGHAAAPSAAAGPAAPGRIELPAPTPVPAFAPDDAFGVPDEVPVLTGDWG